MEDQAEGLSGNSIERSESLKSFSDAQLLGELKKRLLGNPSVDPVVVQALQQTVTELQKKAEAVKPPQIEPVADSKVENSAESEGKRWAEILRKEGAGRLRGKFRKSWTFTNPSGKEEQVSDEEGPFTGGGYFGNEVKVRIVSSDVSKSLGNKIGVFEKSMFEYMKLNGQLTSFVITDALNSQNDNNFGDWKGFLYSTPLQNAPDARGGVIKLDFSFALPGKRAEELVDSLKAKGNGDLIEDIFQNMYPGLTGENGAKRIIVDKMEILNRSASFGKELPYKLPFSRPVGEAKTLAG